MSNTITCDTVRRQACRLLLLMICCGEEARALRVKPEQTPREKQHRAGSTQNSMHQRVARAGQAHKPSRQKPKTTHHQTKGGHISPHLSRPANRPLTRLLVLRLKIGNMAISGVEVVLVLFAPSAATWEMEGTAFGHSQETA